MARMSLEKVLRWASIIGIFVLPVVPLIVATPLFFPFITGKNFAYRAIVEITAGIWLALALMDARYRPKRGWILGTFALFILIIAIADAQGANPFKSFWSNYERMDGWITIAHLFVYFVVASVVMNTERLWRRLFQWSMVISLYLSVYGLLQILGVVTLGESGGSAGLSSRIDATFGNPIYLAVYMLFHVFLAVLLWEQMWVAKAKGKRLWPSVFYGIVVVCDTLALCFTGTRGTMLGLAIGAIITAVLFILFIRNKQLTRVAGAVLAVILVLGAGLWIARDTGFVHQIGFLDRLATVTSDDTTIKARVLNMETAWNGVKERPILGWGQENYAIVFDKYYDPRMYADEPWFDRVHNIIFDWLVAGGILGLLSYLSIFAATLWTLWRKNAAGGSAFTPAERSIITGLLVGYFVHNLTVFDNVTSYILFGTVLAYVYWRNNSVHSPAPITAAAIAPKSAYPYVAMGTIILGLVAAWMINWNALQENVALLGALERPSIEAFQKAISYGTFGTQEAREQLAQMAAQAGAASSQNVPDTVKQQFYTTAVNEMELQEKVSPLDARFPLFIGTVQDAFGKYTDAAQSLEKAHELSPRKQSILFQVGLNQQALGDLKGSEDTFKQAYELDTDDTQALGFYIAAAVRAGDDATAAQLLTPDAMTSGSVVTQQLASAYAARGTYAKIVPIWTAYLAANPTDETAYKTLAAAYFETQDTAHAISTLEALAKAVPSSASEVSSIISQIQSGAVKPQ